MAAPTNLCKHGKYLRHCQECDKIDSEVVVLLLLMLVFVILGILLR